MKTFCGVCLVLMMLLGLNSVQGQIVQWPASEGGNDHYYQAVALA